MLYTFRENFTAIFYYQFFCITGGVPSFGTNLNFRSVFRFILVESDKNHLHYLFLSN